MLYSTNNVQISLTVALAEYLRAQGYDVYWHTAALLEEQTAGLAEAKAIITLVPEFPSDPVFILPANPENVQRLKSEGVPSAEVIVPALSLQIIGSPRKGKIQGLGHRDYEWTRDLRVDGLAADAFQHRALADLLFEWLSGNDYRYLPVNDYDTNPTTPPALSPVEVLQDSSSAIRNELIHEVAAIRYYVQAQTRISYVE